MTIVESPQAAEQKEKNESKKEEILSTIDQIFTALKTVRFLYQVEIQKVNNIKASTIGLNTGPWQIATTDSADPEKDNIFNYITKGPVAPVVTESNPNINILQIDTVFERSLPILDQIQTALTDAQTAIKADNTEAQNRSLAICVDLVDNIKILLLTYIDAINITNSNITNPASPIYLKANAVQPEYGYGPFSNDEISRFRLPQVLLDTANAAENLESELSNISNLLNKSSDSNRDVTVRVLSNGTVLTQDPNDPNILNTDSIEEKDPWGIRFSYVRTISGATYLEEKELIPNTSISRGNKTLTEDTTKKEEPFIEDATIRDVKDKIVNQKKDFYFQLLPAIKSNLPVSAGTDVPGAMPGIQFRIENNIVKHRIPGFAPVYQPLGIESIKCTLVGMFTGNDGIDISSAYSDDLNAGLLAPPETTSKINPANVPNNFKDGANVPIPNQSKSSTSTNVAVLTEDAFRGAQEFYNEIVAPGVEVEVELNLRKGTGDFEGGSIGPFRDEITGNPKFKALIKKLDLYYVRRDRCWFILDLEVTNSGLLSDKCINLTNIIDESVDLFEQVEEDIQSLSKEDMDKCFKNPKTFYYTKKNSGYALVVDKNTGLSYEYRIDNNTLKAEGSFPTQPLETLNKLRADFTGDGSTRGAQRDVFKTVVDILYNIITETKLASEDPNQSDFRFASNRVKAYRNGLSGTQGYLAYNKNDGLFYMQVKQGGLYDVPETQKAHKKSFKEIYNLDNRTIGSISYDEQGGDLQEGLRFFIDELAPISTFKELPSDCQGNFKNASTNSAAGNSTTSDASSNTPANAGTNANSTDNKFFTQENKEAVLFDLNNTKDSRSYASFKNLISNAVTDANNLMSRGTSTATNITDITNELKSTLIQKYNNKSLYLISNAKFIIKENSLKTLSSSTPNELHITFLYQVESDYIIVANGKQYKKSPYRLVVNTNADYFGSVKVVYRGEKILVNAIKLT
jgi:hypothetical protein